MRTHNIIAPSPTRPQETKEAVSAVDGGAQQRIVVAAEPRTNKEQRISAPLVEGEWIAVDVHVNEEEGLDCGLKSVEPGPFLVAYNILWYAHGIQKRDVLLGINRDIFWNQRLSLKR